MSNEKFSEKMGDAMLDPRHNRIWKGVLWLLGLLLLVDVLLSWCLIQEPDLRELPCREYVVAGETIARELIYDSDTLLSNPARHRSNDIQPHRVWLANLTPCA